nr:hypothetical protein [Rhodopirellula sp. MGV]
MPVAVEVREDSVTIFVLKEIRIPAAFSFLIGFRFIDPRFPRVRQINTHHLRGLAWIAAGRGQLEQWFARGNAFRCSPLLKQLNHFGVQWQPIPFTPLADRRLDRNSRYRSLEIKTCVGQ